MSQVTLIGNITVDHFISLPTNFVDTHCNLTEQECTITVPYGGKIPIQDTEVHIGGNAANVSVGLRRLGHEVFPILPLGKDVFSTIALGKLAQEDIYLESNLINERNKCDSSYILRYSGERTILSHHESKSYPLPEEICCPYVYYSSHDGENTSLSTQVLSLCKKNNSKLIFAPANSQIKGDKSILELLVAHSFLFICNKSEAYEIISKIDYMEINIMYMLHRLNHFGAHHVVITDGANGVYYLDGDSGKSEHLDSVIRQDEIVDSTGAGDAMCTGVIDALINGKPLEEGVKNGLKDSASVLKFVGAQTGLLRTGDL